MVVLPRLLGPVLSDGAGILEQDFPEIVRRDADGWRRIQGGAFEPLLMEGLRFHDQRIAKLEEENRGLRDSDATLRRELAELRERVLQIEPVPKTTRNCN